MSLFMSIILLLLACVAYAIVANLTISAIIDLRLPMPSDALWIITYTVLGTICVRMGLLLLAGAYPHD